MTNRDRPAGLRHFSASLPMMLLRAREAVMQHFRVMLRENGITEQQWRVLRALHARPGLDATELAKATVLLAPSLTRILRDLEAQSMIATAPDGVDGRRKLVRLTPAGLERIGHIAPHSEEIYAAIADRFGAERLAELGAMLGELEGSLRPKEPIDGLDTAAKSV